MDAPKCRLCEKRHYGQCASFGGVSPPDKPNTPKRGGAQRSTAVKNESVGEVKRTAEPAALVLDSEKKSDAPLTSDKVAKINTPEVSENDSPPLSQSERNARYRARNRDKYNAYMRDWRRRQKDD